MHDDEVDEVVRRAIGGEGDARQRLLAADTGIAAHPMVWVMRGLLAGDPTALLHALTLATTRRDRQVVEIARAHLVGDHDLVDALARDHLVDHPDSIVVAWIAAGALGRTARPERR